MTLRLNGDSSGFTEIKAADAAGDNSIKLPASNGSANQLLQNGGTAGELQYTSAGGGLHYDSSGRLLVGTSSSTGITGVLQAVGASSVFHRADDDQYPSIVYLSKARGTGTQIVASQDNIGNVSFIGYDGTSPLRAAEIGAYVDGTPGSSVMPGKLTFSTNAGSAAPTPRIEIGSNGALKLLAGCPGIDFSDKNPAAVAGTMTSETLSAYEEGTWTPSVTFGGNNVGLTYAPSAQNGHYVRVGNVCIAQFGVRIANRGTSTGALEMVGLPFNALQSSYYHGGVCFTMLDAPSSLAHAQMFVSGTTFQFRFGQDNNTVPNETAVISNMSIFGTAIYLIPNP